MKDWGCKCRRKVHIASLCQSFDERSQVFPLKWEKLDLASMLQRYFRCTQIYICFAFKYISHSLIHIIINVWRVEIFKLCSLFKETQTINFPLQLLFDKSIFKILCQLKFEAKSVVEAERVLTEGNMLVQVEIAIIWHPPLPASIPNSTSTSS